MATSSNSAGIVQAAEQIQLHLQGPAMPIMSSGLLGIVNLLVELSKKQQEIDTRLAKIEHGMLVARIQSDSRLD
jgi:hypothetical protein